MTVVSPGVPGRPVSPGRPGSPCGPGGPGTGTGTGTATVTGGGGAGRSHPPRPSALTIAINAREVFMDALSCDSVLAQWLTLQSNVSAQAHPAQSADAVAHCRTIRTPGWHMPGAACKRQGAMSAVLIRPRRPFAGFWSDKTRRSSRENDDCPSANDRRSRQARQTTTQPAGPPVQPPNAASGRSRPALGGGF